MMFALLNTNDIPFTVPIFVDTTKAWYVWIMTERRLETTSPSQDINYPFCHSRILNIRAPLPDPKEKSVTLSPLSLQL